MVYRKEIDGLRALAVIPVILYHGGFKWFSGGFVGVDVFFVISGYLITSIIITEKQGNYFFIAHFYERRVRRIFPALFFVMLVSMPFAWFWLLPHELIDFAKSIIAVSVFSSNFLFWQESGYFAADAEFIPLLHTWSLAVEEQFYVFFPLMIILFWKYGKYYLVGLISIIALLSLGLSEWGWRYYPDANFYLLASRAWELMIGALCAFYLLNNKQLGGKIGQLCSLLGFLLILYAIFFLHKDIPFPSLYALAPTLGTALIILFATPQTIIGKLLSLRLFVALGLISYSAYLWHVPLFVFARVRFPDETSKWLILLLSLLALVLAYFSWHFIEKPFRDKQRFTRKQIFTGGFIGSLLFVCIGLTLLLLEGAPFRFLE